MAAIQKITILITGFLLLQSFGCEEKYSDDSFLFEQPVTYDQLIEEGWIYFQAGDYETSIESFITASERDATQPEVYLGLGWGYARNIELTKSVSNFQKAISDPIVLLCSVIFLISFFIIITIKAKSRQIIG